MISKDSIKEHIYDMYLNMKYDNYHTDFTNFENYTLFTTKEYMSNLLNDNTYSRYLINKNENESMLKYIFHYDNDYIIISFEEFIVNIVAFQIDIFKNLNDANNLYDTI